MMLYLVEVLIDEDSEKSRVICGTCVWWFHFIQHELSPRQDAYLVCVPFLLLH